MWRATFIQSFDFLGASLFVYFLGSGFMARCSTKESKGVVIEFDF
jgi:hypothetical protein